MDHNHLVSLIQIIKACNNLVKHHLNFKIFKQHLQLNNKAVIQILFNLQIGKLYNKLKFVIFSNYLLKVKIYGNFSFIFGLSPLCGYLYVIDF